MKRKSLIVAGLVTIIGMGWAFIQLKQSPGVQLETVQEDTAHRKIYKKADPNQYPTDEDWMVFWKLEGKHSDLLKELFGEPVHVSSEVLNDGQMVTRWDYPWYAVTCARIDDEGIIVQVWSDSGY